MWYNIFILLGLANFAYTFWPASYKVQLNDEKVFVISAGGDDDDDDDEMIKPQESRDISKLIDDEEKYKPLHSHVEHYNRRAAEEASRHIKSISYPQHIAVERRSADAGEPFVAGFKDLLDRSKRKNDEAGDESAMNFSGDDLVESMGSRNHSHPDENPSLITPNSTEDYYSGATTTARSEFDESEPTYDYEELRAEYYQQIEEGKSQNMTLNFTENEEPEEGVRDAIKKLVKFDMPKNCTKEELTQFGAGALECLAFDYERAKTKNDVRRVLARTWIILRVWICIYLCIAVPCWCQKGWCCCCFRCSICFPEERIVAAKRYYAQNSPGVFVDEHKKNGKKHEPIAYEPTIFELDAYENLESAIRNL